ncbi:hypothetical protein H310_15272 [Aphanomyces invadans]|uniref:Peptidase S1 domain-containing protein n=1 Tax=Aphanomyces invadans TaxID=157072 RepID=A0A024T9A6_9STRA|nr:hypothetical protein H310_15272 [Aphanomyces invadans]ETV89887.1 hypothetical protein H310_15272 [Aphanomyces invadans]RHY19823.1 hypothetical protein DYB32_010171 [Aphanomyces invadans]|eukprot:XP_008881481.1 hypothetical protein H310_15272 [Aphanomyces invadans]
MAKFLALAAVAASAAAQVEVVNGTDVPVSKYPFVTTIREAYALSPRCVASLIAPKVLLASASCYSISPSGIYASIGTYLWDKDAELIKIVKQTPHPKFNSDTGDFDLAIFELETESKAVPVALKFNEDAENELGMALGFDLDDAEGVLMEDDVKIWSNDDCAEAYGSDVLPSTMCAGGGDNDTCFFVPGTPLTITRNGVQYVVGVGHSGDRCFEPGVPGSYSRVSAAHDFIQSFLSNTTTEPAS